MTEPIRVLVTAVGGDVGQASVKALRLSAEPIECHGCDGDSTGSGSAFVDSFHAVPYPNDATYVEALDRLCCSLAVHVVVPCSDAEIHSLSRLGSPPRLPSGVPVVCQEADWIDKYGDKLTCMKVLSGEVRLAPFSDGNDLQAVRKLVDEVGFPVVIKSRCSRGSRSLRLANDDAELDAALAVTSLPLVQAFIDASEGEFSVGVFVCEHFSAAIAFKRDLGPVGLSWFAETSTDQSVLDYTMRIARVSGLRGSANIQVRKSSKGVSLLEINPRFSSLAAARAVCGFRDVEWSVESALGRSHNRLTGHFRHIRFRRFFHELVDFGEGYKAVSEWAPKEAPVPN